jgi:hypothetical protein
LVSVCKDLARHKAKPRREITTYGSTLLRGKSRCRLYFSCPLHLCHETSMRCCCKHVPG